MNFASALFALERGHKIKRKHWKGYWCKAEKDGKTIVEIHTKDGEVINLQDTEDILYTMENMACNDWEIADPNYEVEENDCEEEHVKVLVCDCEYAGTDKCLECDKKPYEVRYIEVEEE